MVKRKPARDKRATRGKEADPSLLAEREWLATHRRKMETDLETLGLPANAWEAMELLPIYMAQLDDPREVRLFLDFGILLKWFKRERDSQRRALAYFSAGVARVCDILLRGPSAAPWAGVTAANRAVLWRLLERCETFRQTPKQGMAALRHMLSEEAKRARKEEGRRAAPVHEGIRAEFERLRAKGHAGTKAAAMIQSDPIIRERIQAIARKERVRPWRRGDFYSFAGIRKIVGV